MLLYRPLSTPALLLQTFLPFPGSKKRRNDLWTPPSAAQVEQRRWRVSRRQRDAALAHARNTAAAECGTWRWARSKRLAADRSGLDGLKCFIVLSFASDERSSRPAPRPDPSPIPSPKDTPLGFWFWKKSQHPGTNMSGALQSPHPQQREPPAGNVRR